MTRETATASTANPTDDDLLTAYLAGRDAACSTCGYNLRGAEAARCPECGRDLALTVAGSAPRFHVAWTLLVAALAVLSVNGVTETASHVYFYLVTAGLQNYWWVWLPSVQLVGVPLLLAALVKRCAFVRVSTRRRWILTIPAILAAAFFPVSEMVLWLVFLLG